MYKNMNRNLLRRITFDLIRHVEGASGRARCGPGSGRTRVGRGRVAGIRRFTYIAISFYFSAGPVLPSDVRLFSGSLTANVLIFFTRLWRNNKRL